MPTLARHHVANIAEQNAGENTAAREAAQRRDLITFGRILGSVTVPRPIADVGLGTVYRKAYGDTLKRFL